MQGSQMDGDAILAWKQKASNGGSLSYKTTQWLVQTSLKQIPQDQEGVFPKSFHHKETWAAIQSP